MNRRPYCLCYCGSHPSCPVDHYAEAESLSAAVAEKIGAMSYGDLRGECADYRYGRSQSPRWPRSVRFGKWLRGRIENQVLREWGAA